MKQAGAELCQAQSSIELEASPQEYQISNWVTTRFNFFCKNLLTKLENERLIMVVHQPIMKRPKNNQYSKFQIQDERNLNNAILFERSNVQHLNVIFVFVWPT